MTAKTDLETTLKQEQIRKTRAEADKAELERNKLAREEEQHYNADYTNHTYTFYDGVDDDSVKDCISELSYWMRAYPKCPATIVLNSPGGYCVDGLALYDFLRDMRKAGHKITIKVYGQASSMGGILLQAGDRRVMGRFSYLLIHEPAGGAIGKGSIIRDTAEWVDELWDKLAEILAERSKLTKAEIKEKANRKDWILWGAEAKRLGFCDAVS